MARLEHLPIWRVAPRCSRCSRRLTAATTIGWSRRPRLVFCAACAAQTDLERRVPS